MIYCFACSFLVSFYFHFPMACHLIEVVLPAPVCVYLPEIAGPYPEIIIACHTVLVDQSTVSQPNAQVNVGDAVLANKRGKAPTVMSVVVDDAVVKSIFPHCSIVPSGYLIQLPLALEPDIGGSLLFNA
jgi:hypothetical protein